MNKWLKRIRGALGVGLTWAVAWGFVGPLLVGLLIGVLMGGNPFAVNLLGTALSFAWLGFIGGVAFSVVLGLAEGRRTFDEMSLPRFAGWGALVAPLAYVTTVALLGFGWRFPLGMLAVTALLGAGSAAGSLALARMADRKLLEAGADVADIGLTQEEKRELLGG